MNMLQALPRLREECLLFELGWGLRAFGPGTVWHPDNRYSNVEDKSVDPSDWRTFLFKDIDMAIAVMRNWNKYLVSHHQIDRIIKILEETKAQNKTLAEVT